ncbi:GNAT family N-acetyltransferase [Plastoroseomonas arctica]|uniref:GNAT family N-acetyltransferase n=1 Tax=Plastoroseomonas arctica TaxID=1509237 RepID=A0AAF1KPH3_9PROT|nr:GNAT family N-acetyltransferase [Plastoroseomonas arctica]MBR0655963.1 GNAT family N-acetyltransferase [Plastoroseomonas arctica]
MIRMAVAADAAAIRACADAAYRPYVAAIGREPAPMVADFAAQIALGIVHVAVAGDALQGFIVFCPEADHMLLENVAVDPASVGQGIGKSLIAFCEAVARHAGFPEVRLYTNARMKRNLALYPRLGYAEVGRRHEDGFDRVFFAKQL